MNNKPNVIFVFADQWRQEATGYAGNPDVKTPNLDALARESINFTHALSGCPVCSPYRASMLTGRRPLTHGVFVNDVYLQPDAVSIAQAFSGAGYDTAYIGKWHVGGHGRSAYIPPEQRLGFDYWKVLECTHDYNHSAYYAGDSSEKLYWQGYDAIAQTRDAENYIRNRDKDKPFFMALSWGPPHNPYETAPERFQALYNQNDLTLRDNVPPETASKAREWLAGYYAHCSALDSCIGEIRSVMKDCGIDKETIFVFTSDHGDMLGSQNATRKQRPWDEAIRVPFLLHYPALPVPARETSALIDAPDIMPTLLGLCDIPIPDTVEGKDFAAHIKGEEDASREAALLMCAHPFGEWSARNGGKEYRGLRTVRYTYARDLKGPWLLYDNEQDPFQKHNLVNDENAADIREKLDNMLWQKLAETGDEFLPGMEYIKKRGYKIDETGTVPYTL